MENEYLDRFVKVMGPPDQWDVRFDAFRARSALVKEYAWAVPTDEALDVLVRLSPIIEIGAGGGYWAALLRARGADVVAYDETPPGNGRENWHAVRLWTEVRRAPAVAARYYPERTLFLCWPPYATPMAYAALYGYLERGGQTLVFVGEDRWGCTGDDDFFDLLYARMEEAGTVALPQWPGIHDYLHVYRRKGESGDSQKTKGEASVHATARRV